MLEMTSTLSHLEGAPLQTSIISGFTNTDLLIGKYGFFSIGKLQMISHFEYILNILRRKSLKCHVNEEILNDLD